MIQALLDNSVWIIFTALVIVLAIRELSKKASKQNLTVREYLECLRPQFNVLASEFFTKALAALIITLFVSFISFREIWINDVFHVVFLTSILLNKIEGKINAFLS